jgi:hypothetical protein
MSTISLSSPALLPPDLAVPAASLTRGAKAAREFEAHLLGSLLDSLEKTFATVPGANSTPGEDDYSYLGTEALASALADSGGFGLGAMIAQHLGEHEGKG